jgi:hypothetical protein
MDKRDVDRATESEIFNMTIRPDAETELDDYTDTMTESAVVKTTWFTLVSDNAINQALIDIMVTQ